MTTHPSWIPDGFPIASFREAAEFLEKNLKDPPFVLQIGAMDGVQFDFLRPFLLTGKWQALLVEPMPDMFAGLQQTYANVPGMAFANCAVADHDGVLKMHRVDPVAVAAGHVAKEMLAFTSAYSDRGPLSDPERIHPAILTARNYLIDVDAPCMTLPQLLELHKVEKIDLLMIDTEGGDWMIARQLDLNRYKPSLISLEFNSLTGQEMQECTTHFVSHGYTLALCQEDSDNLLFFPKAWVKRGD